MLLVAGSKATTLHFSRDAVSCARPPKELFSVHGRTDRDLLYDVQGHMWKLVAFFNDSLCQK